MVILIESTINVGMTNNLWRLQKCYIILWRTGRENRGRVDGDLIMQHVVAHGDVSYLRNITAEASCRAACAACALRDMEEAKERWWCGIVPGACGGARRRQCVER